jgi:hypothetical protein
MSFCKIFEFPPSVGFIYKSMGGGEEEVFANGVGLERFSSDPYFLGWGKLF